MSNVNSGSLYTIDFQISPSEGEAFGSLITIPAEANVPDAVVAAIGKALRDVDYPEGVAAIVTVDRVETVKTDYRADLDAGVFS